MPPRPAKSPARERASSSEARPAKSPAPPKNGKAKGKAKVEDEPVDAEAEAAAAAAAGAPAAAPAAAKKAGAKVGAPAAAAPAPAAPPPTPTASLPSPLALGAVVALLLALLGGGGYAAYASSKVKPLPMIGPKAFEGTNLKLSGGFTGVSLVAFTDKSDSNCQECKLLNGVLKKAAHKGLLGAFSAETLKIGKVYCDRHDELCTRFGVTGDEPEAMGVPALLWFRNGTFVGPYEGQRTPEDIKVWAQTAALAVSSE